MIGPSPAFQHAVEQATQVARSDVGVLLSGESGTGKELLAAHVHRESPFASAPFVKVNCAAIPTELIESELFGHEKGAFTGAASLRRGKFELADGGTIFLDEVGDLHEASQAKLLRILQDGELQRVGGEQPIHISVRVISATNRRLDELVAAGAFREDLYYRLSVVPIRVPALRERREDIGALVGVFPFRVLRPQQLPASRDRSGRGAGARALRLARQRPRAEKRRRADGDSHPRRPHHRGVDSARGPEPQAPRPAAGLQEVRDTAERDRIRQALDQTDWNVSGAARLLGTERTSLHKRLRALGLKRK